MVEDDWSLKGTEVDTWHIGRKRYEHWNMYRDSDIEVLRQKLIKDMNLLIGVEDDISDITKDLLYQRIGNKINKRFGVE
ncbi:MAG: hypothetical protein IMZ52_01150 [Actinobacteria bacterium]|nr:hypothetical protein [Actinomycetota bacterium]MBE3114745.1 hypothetical protein [Actinomycetota bacterium]